MKTHFTKNLQRTLGTFFLVAVSLLAVVPSRLGAVDQPPQTAATAGDARYGINFVSSGDANSSLRYQQATGAGAKWTRWPMYWHEIEGNRGSRNYSVQDRLVDLDYANGLQTHAILMATPSWAATAGNPEAPFPKVGERSFKPLITPQGVQLSSTSSPPSGLNLAWNDPNNTWGQFVYATVSRYKNKVKVWEIWNEPDWTYFWSGTATDYYRLMKVGYQAAKAADPQATVLFGGLSYWNNTEFLPTVLDIASRDPDGRGSAFFFDALPWHPYIDPYFVLDWTQRARTQMQQKLGIVKPVWVNETNIPVCDEWPTTCSGGATWRATLDEQAAYVIQAYAYAFAVDIPRLSIFQLWDDGLVADQDYYGLVTNNAVARPSLKAYQVAATYLASPSRVTRSPGAGYEMVILEGTPQGKVTVVWATQGGEAQVGVPASSASAKLVDQAGNVTNVSPSGGNYWLTLPRATNNRDPSGRYIVGGRPYLLVEPAGANLSSQVNALPATAADRSFTVAWSRLDNSGVQAVFDVQYRVGTTGTWSDWLVGTTYTAAQFGPASPLSVQDGQTYYFRSRLRDGSGGAEQYPDGNGDANTTIPYFLTGRVLDNRGNFTTGAIVSAGSYMATTSFSDFRIAVPAGSYDVAASLSGYGIIPARHLSFGPSLSYTFVLPPLSNYVQNWGFEGSGGVGEWWTPSGAATTSTDWMHSGAKAAKLGEWNVKADASLSQSNINIPAGIYRPTVSFMYAVPSAGSGGDSFFLDVTSGTGTVSYPISLDTQGTWAHKWLDMGSVSGPITLNFRLHKANANQLRVFLDEVSVGKAPGGPLRMYFPMTSKQ